MIKRERERERENENSTQLTFAGDMSPHKLISDKSNMALVH